MIHHIGRGSPLPACRGISDASCAQAPCGRTVSFRRPMSCSHQQLASERYWGCFWGLWSHRILVGAGMSWLMSSCQRLTRSPYSHWSCHGWLSRQRQTLHSWVSDSRLDWGICSFGYSWLTWYAFFCRSLFWWREARLCSAVSFVCLCWVIGSFDSI